MSFVLAVLDYVSGWGCWAKACPTRYIFYQLISFTTDLVPKHLRAVLWWQQKDEQGHSPS